MTNVFVSANSTVGSTSLRPEAVTDSYYLITLPSPQTTIPLSLRAARRTSQAASRSSSAARRRAGRPATSPSSRFSSIATPTCTYALLNGTTNFGAGGGQGSVNVSVQPGCGWQLSSNQPFVSVASSSRSRFAARRVHAWPPTPGRRAPPGSRSPAPMAAARRSTSPRRRRLPVLVLGAGEHHDPHPRRRRVARQRDHRLPGAAGRRRRSRRSSRLRRHAGTGTGTATLQCRGQYRLPPSGEGPCASRSPPRRIAGRQHHPEPAQTTAAPVAVIGSPGTCNVNSACGFNGAQSQNQVTSWAWDFGDGTTGSGAIVTHTYPRPSGRPRFSSRVATVRLTVTGPGGTNSTTTHDHANLLATVRRSGD